MTPRQSRMIQEVERHLNRLFWPRDVIELRVLKGSESYGGFYDDLRKAAEDAVSSNIMGYNSRYGLNPRDPVKCPVRNALTKGRGAVAGDVLQRTKLLIKLSSKPPKTTWATKAEKTSALQTADGLALSLKDDFGWSTPHVVDSGNGFHLVYKIALPTNDQGLVKSLLKVIDARVGSNSFTQVDTNVFDAQRVLGIPGTINWKMREVKGQPPPYIRVKSYPSGKILQASDLEVVVADWGA